MASPAPTSTPKKVPVKGKPMGIPVWGWVIAAVIGIVIGYTILKKSGGGIASPISASGAETGSGIAEEESSGGGSIALPLEDILAALGLRGGTIVEPPPQSSPISEDSPAQQEAQFSAEQESISSPEILPMISPDYLPGFLYGPTEQNPDAQWVNPALDLDMGIGSTIAASQLPTSLPGSDPVSTSTFVQSTPEQTAQRLGYSDVDWAM